MYSPQLRIIIATELSSLQVILMKKWMKYNVVCVCLYVRMHVYVCLSVCMYVCMYVHVVCTIQQFIVHREGCLSLREGVVKEFCDLLELISNFGNTPASHHLTAHMFATAHMILKLAPPTESEQIIVSQQFKSLFYLLGHSMIPLVYGVLRKYPDSVEHSRVIIIF